MKIDLQLLRSPTGQLVTVGLLAMTVTVMVAWQHRPSTTEMAPIQSTPNKVSLPQVCQRSGARLNLPAPQPPTTVTQQLTDAAVALVPMILPLSVSYLAIPTAEQPVTRVIPFGRLIPCETVFALESNRLDTPVIGLVTEEVWSEGQLIIPLGTEVHGHATLDRSRARISAQGRWTLIGPPRATVRRTTSHIDAVALERSDGRSRNSEEGSAGLRGVVFHSSQAKEARLFAATFLATATTALQDTRSSAGLLGESIVPAATIRNASLAGTSAVLRDYAAQLAKAVAEDGVYVRVPAGKPFYLYVTSTDSAAADQSSLPTL